MTSCEDFNSTNTPAPNTPLLEALRKAAELTDDASPDYLAPSAWIEHIPFAFWLVPAARPTTFVELGTHWGTSYFAFCQAVKSLNIRCSCFAVDHWKGDRHAGEYSDEVFHAAQKHNALYKTFSILIKDEFSSARRHFSDSSIDILHIDGCHTYEAAREDFHSWLPKMSSRGVVLMHDTRVEKSDFGVKQLFSEIKESYRTFEFLHGHGLGAIGVGPDADSNLELLFKADKSEDDRSAVRTHFANLGAWIAKASKSPEGQQESDLGDALEDQRGNS